ncbi:hypothetical protein SAMN05421736_10647 [Evansella caseinilytica]|uniref:DUF5105 domain-containing protein n=1 Tax=Evansella caseinilytica TaxID=1503961 RepID=A0A1H3Q7R6_9BACI|nr:DUF6612 family protein [Evansella caseinilytica]SDZ09310.1 hypothetical protein SAMN05421736_10647 [Evansella caseinilytica]
MAKVKLAGLLFIGIMFLAACSGEPTVEKVLEMLDEAHEDLQSVQVNMEEKENGVEYVLSAQLDYENEIYYIEVESTDLVLYKDNDGFETLVANMVVDPEYFDVTVYEQLMDNLVNQHHNQLKRLQTFDKDVYEKFDLELKDDEYLLTYTGDEASQQIIVEGYVDEYKSYGNQDLTVSDIVTEGLSFKVIVDKETNRIKEFDQQLKYSFTIDGTEMSFDSEAVFTYTNYQAVGEIEKPEVNSEPAIGLSEEEQELYETEAVQYLEALIEATVYQNEKTFAANAPGPDSEEDKQSEGEFQKESFKEFYRYNTEANMGGLVSDEQINELTEAFMVALSGTSYEVVNSRALADDHIEVALAIEGIQDWEIMTMITEKVLEELESGEIAEEDLAKRQVELMIDIYENDAPYSDPVEVNVNVMRTEDGSYLVLLQDEYLVGGFVQ